MTPQPYLSTLPDILFHRLQFCAHRVRTPAINHCLLLFDVSSCCAFPVAGGVRLVSSHLNQSSPKSSTGCCVRIVPFPQRRSSAEQYLSHPQQIRSGCFGLSATFVFGTLAICGYRRLLPTSPSTGRCTG